MYNLALETKNAAYIGSKHNYSAFDLIKQLPELKKELPWLKEVNSQSLQQSIQNMDIAFKKFFKGAGFPNFKKKSNKGNFNIPQNVIVENDLLIIPKFKEGIKMSLHRPTKGTIKSATVSVTPTGKYFVSIHHNLAQAISDASWSTFVSMLEYKADWYGKNILRIGQFVPSSKTCSCGVINKDLKLSDRTWTCKSCGATHDRDILAACNIKSFALKNIFSGTESKNQDELPGLLGVMTPEALLIA